MEKTFKIFHYISFIQYPFLIAGLFYAYKPLIFGMETLLSDVNSAFFMIGIALSFTSLADIRKRTKLGDKIFGSATNTRRWLVFMCFFLVLIFSYSTFLYFFSKNELLKEMSTGMFVFGLGYTGLVRMNLEIIRSYQQNPPQKKI